MRRERVVIIGSGPAGMAAAVYTGRAQLKPLVIVGNQLGGQVSLTHEIENYPGFVDPLSGTELVEQMKAQSERFGAEFLWDSVTAADFSQRPFKISTYGEEILTDSVIVTIGADPRKLNIPGEAEYVGRGVSYCGTCDGFFFRGKEVVVVGGGDSAFEEALFLTRFATKVTMMYRAGQDKLRAGIQLQQRALHNEKITMMYHTVVNEIKVGEHGSVNAVNITDHAHGQTYDFKTDGIFIFVGHTPNSKVFGQQLAMDDSGYVITDERYRTSLEGVFAAGEIQDPIWKQVATSVGQGTSAAMSAIHWLEENEHLLQSLDVTVETGA